MAENRSRAILDFGHCLLSGSGNQPFAPEQYLAQLSELMEVESAGLAGLIDNTVVIHLHSESESAFPRALESTFLKENLISGESAISQTIEGRPVLAVASEIQRGAVWALWLADDKLATPAAEELAALNLVAALLGKQVAALPQFSDWSSLLGCSQRRRRLEDASRVAGRVAHDFNNVLAGILGFTELSLSQLPADMPVRRLVKEVFDAGQHGIRLVNQLESFGRRNRLSSQPFRLQDALAKVENRLEKLGAEKPNLKLDLAEDLPSVGVDGETLLLILDPVVDNAIEAMTPSGTLTISARPKNLGAKDSLAFLGNCGPGPCVELVISDNGCGFDLEARERVLNQPFFTNKLRHRGLGLAAVYGLLTAVRGGIRFEHKEVGTTVTIVLPVNVAREAFATPPPGASSNFFQNRATEKVLVVDDDPMTLSLMCTTLERAGFQVQSATDGVSALDSFDTAEVPFRLVLSDVRMPRMTGFELAERLLNRDPGLPIVFTSGHVPPDCIPPSFGAGSYDFLPKPFKPESLVSAVRTALSRKNPRAKSART